MSFGYGIFLGWFALVTTAALAPRTAPLGHVRYLLAVAVNEIPHVFAVALLLAAGSAWWGGDLAGAAGAVGLLASALVLLGLGVLALRAGDAWREVRTGLGPTVLPVTAASTAARGWWAPLPWRPRSVVRRRGRRYGPHRRQRLDVYSRRDGRQDGRVLLYLHGGGYYSGGRHREGRALLHRLADRGWTCVSAGYRLRPGAGFEDHLADARSALRWAHRHALPGDLAPTAVVMAGSSAGAHLSALCALDQPVAEPHQRVDGAVCLYGYYGRYYGRGADEPVVSTPFGHDPGGSPPMLLVHGDRDSWVPVERARAFRDHLAGSAATTAYVELAGAQHGFDLFASPRNRAVLGGVEAFLEHAVCPDAVPGPDRSRRL